MNECEKDTFCSWSGGKESALSLYMATQSGSRVACLVNMITEDGVYSRTHGITASLLSEQALALGIPLIQRRATWDTYEAEFKALLGIFHGQGIRRGIFGDIDLDEHRQWVERVSRESGMNAVLPLWLENRNNLLREFIDTGFKAIIVAVDMQHLDDGWLGREINNEFVRDISSCEVDICGEAGEYHTFVYDGPIFQRKMRFEKGNVRISDGYAFLDIKPVDMKDI